MKYKREKGLTDRQTEEDRQTAGQTRLLNASRAAESRTIKMYLLSNRVTG